MEYIIDIVWIVYGILSVSSASFEWEWFWRLARGGYLPNQIGLRNTRLFYLLTGYLSGVIGTSQLLQLIFSSDSLLFVMLGFCIATGATVTVFNSREDQSLITFLFKNSRH